MGQSVPKAYGHTNGGRKMHDDPILFKAEEGLFSAERIEDIAILYLEKELLIGLTELRARDKLLDFFDRMASSKGIKVLIIINSSEKRGCEEYIDFYGKFIRSNLERKAAHRLYNVFDQIILRIIELDQVTVHADCGCVIPLFLNLSFGCDFRIVADNTVFQNPYLELGLLPKGGSGFFLCRMLGRSRACKLLMFGEDLSAREAFDLGLVDEIVAEEQLKEAALRLARRLALKPATTLTGIKRILNYSMKDLKDYLEFENQELLKLVGLSEYAEENSSNHKKRLKK
jgi:2-(1,2-epoxy-1,2-dihydrophenyl)acetyl-CoA isomerase